METTNISAATSTSTSTKPLLGTSSNLRNHQKQKQFQFHQNKIPKRYKCEFCSLRFFARARYEDHIVDKHVVDTEFECPVCSKTFIDSETLEKHVKVHENRKHFRQGIKYICDICSKQFKVRTGLDYHLKVQHQKNVYCDKCSKSFGNQSEFENHLIPRVEFPLRCLICADFFASQCDLDIHTKSKNCRKSFTRNNLKLQSISHQTQNRADTSSNKSKSKSKSKWKPKVKPYFGVNYIPIMSFKCPVCSKTFNDKENLAQHDIEFHHKAAKYVCGLCCIEFKSQKDLIGHLEAQHNYVLDRRKSGEKMSFVCKSKAEFDPRDLNPKFPLQFKCQKCSEILDSQFNLDIHKRFHGRKTTTGEKKEDATLKRNKGLTPMPISQESKSVLLKCELCPKQFNREADFKSHRMEKHQHPNAEWKCNFEGCSKSFNYYYKLKYHKLTHFRDPDRPRPFVCSICQKSYHFKKSLSYHQKTSHIKVGNVVKNQKCGFCPATFASTFEMRSHAAREHVGPNQFKCPHKNCDETFATNHRLKVHLASHRQQGEGIKGEKGSIEDQRSMNSTIKNKYSLRARVSGATAAVFTCRCGWCLFKTVDEKEVALHYNREHGLPKVLLIQNVFFKIEK